LIRLTFAKAIRFFALATLFFVAGSSFAQNTKGDKPSKPLPRITLKSKPGKTKTVKSNTRDISGRKLRTKNKSSAARAVVTARSPYKGRRSRGGDRAAQPIGGNRARIRSSSAEMARNNVYSNKGPYINNPSKRPRRSERSFANPAPIGQPVLYSTRSNASPYPKKRKISPRSGSRSFVSRGKKNVYWGKFSKGEKPYTKDITGRPLRTKNYRTPPVEIIPQNDPYQGRKRTGDKSKSALGRIFNSRSKTKQKAWNGDVSGKALRRTSSNRKTETVGSFFMPRKFSISGKGRGPGRPVKGSGYQTMGGRGRNNKPLAARIPKGGAGVANYRGSYKQSLSGGGGGGYAGGGGKGIKPKKGGGSISGQSRNNRGNPIPSRIPLGGGGIGGYRGNVKRTQLSPGFTAQGAGYRGGLKSRRPFKGGGSISGQSRNNRNQSIASRIPNRAGAARAGTYQGSIKRWNLSPGFTAQGAGYRGSLKSKRPFKGGGSVSGQSRNNRNQSIATRIPNRSGAARAGTYQGSIKRWNLSPGFTAQGAGYRGSLKSKRPFKGGGSVSGQSRNNRNQSIATRIPNRSGAARAGTYQGSIKRWDLSPGFTTQGAGYRGSMKGRRPEKGGGSISGKPRNNGGYPISAKIPPAFAGRMGRYQGTLKARRPEKGGGSISGRPRNNGGYPISAKIPPAYAGRIGRYQGTLKAKRPEKGGGSISGRPRNNGGYPISAKIPPAYAGKMGKYQGTMKAKRPEKGGGSISGRPRNNNGEPVSVKLPPRSSVRATKFSGSIRAHRPEKGGGSVSGKLWNNDEKAIPSRPRRLVDFANARYQGDVKQSKYGKYVHNPSSAKKALKTIDAGRAYAKINNFQGNVRMSKPHGSKLHPDAKFAHGHIDNVKKERTILVNVKLLWAKLFKKSDNQPAAVKEKVRKPRYDKKERELWKDLYD